VKRSIGILIVFGIVFVLIVLVAIAFGMTTPARAHIPERPDLDNWAMSLKNGGGVPCCDNGEAVPLQEPDWKVNADGHYTVFIDGEWVEVPDSAIVDGPNHYGQVLVWYTHSPGFPVYVRCMLPAAGT
jgi:hypothetical protein